MEVFAVVFYLVLLIGMGLMAWTIDSLYRKTCDDKQYIEQLERHCDSYREDIESYRQRGNGYKEQLREALAARDSLKGLVEHYTQLSETHQGRHRELNGRLDHIIKIASGELVLDDARND